MINGKVVHGGVYQPIITVLGRLKKRQEDSEFHGTSSYRVRDSRLQSNNRPKQNI